MWGKRARACEMVGLVSTVLLLHDQAMENRNLFVECRAGCVRVCDTALPEDQQVFERASERASKRE